MSLKVKESPLVSNEEVTELEQLLNQVNLEICDEVTGAMEQRVCALEDLVVGIGEGKVYGSMSREVFKTASAEDCAVLDSCPKKPGSVLCIAYLSNGGLVAFYIEMEATLMASGGEA